jgi:hypothetical protein
MLKKNIVLCIIFAFIGFTSFSQNQVDALRYSFQFSNSTAKSAAMGNSLSAVGADLSVTSSNPAGLGVFKSTTITFTPNFIIDNSEGTFQGNMRSENKVGMSITNFGYAGVSNREGKTFKQFSFAINYNRTNDFRQDIIVSGVNSNGSIIDYFVYNANSPYDDIYNDRWSIFRENLADSIHIIDYDNTLSEYFSFVTDDAKYGETQRKSVVRKGGTGVYDFSFAGNIGDFLYLGGTVGFANVSYSQKTDNQETGYADIYAESVTEPGTFIRVNPTTLNFSETLLTYGTGINFKFGMILQPVKFIRIGAAIHSSTFYNFTDEYRTTMNSEFASPDTNGDFDYFVDSENNLFTWKLQTPFRANAGIAFIFDQKQLGKFYTIPMTLSFDYDFTDYSNAHLKSYDFEYDFINENTQIESEFGQSHSLRAGLELNFGMIKVRGGYQVITTPYSNQTISLANSISAYSGGVGFGKEHFFLDLAYTFRQYNETLYMYDATNSFPLDPIGGRLEPTASIFSKTQYFQLTAGLKF